MPTIESNKLDSDDESNLTDSSDDGTDSSDYGTDSSDYGTDSSDNGADHSDNLKLEGKILNKYNIIYEIGKGADAIVWLAFNIEDSKYYAIKINEPKEYKKGVEEFKFLKKLPSNLKCFNHLIESFVHQETSKKYSCGVFELHTGNLDCLLRKGEFEKGLSIKLVKKIMLQLLISLKYLHQKMKIYHADIKTDNILLKGFNSFDEDVLNQYNKLDFFKNYEDAKTSYCNSKGVTLDTIKKEEKLKIRELVHKIICSQINLPEKKQKYIIDKNHIEKCDISLADFGAFCREDEDYEGEFGTRYYRAPEIILMGKCNYKVDIWAAGCVLYELLTGKILFDPEKDKTHCRDSYHLYHINRHLGNFPIGFLKKTEHWKNYFDKNGDLKDFKIEKRHFKDKLTEYNVLEQQDEIVDLLHNMLCISPNQRFDADKCLQHSLFKKLNN